MPFCVNCGQPVKENHQFCQSCGIPVEPLVKPAPFKAESSEIIQQLPAVPLSHAESNGWRDETVTVVVYDIQLAAGHRERRDYNLIITNFRSIFAQITERVGQAAIKKRHDDLSARGKGFLGKWKSQVFGPNMYVEWYNSITPEQALTETVGNFAVDNASVVSIQTKMYGGGEDQPSEFHTEIQTTGQYFKIIAAYDTDKLLKQVFNKELFRKN